MLLQLNVNSCDIHCPFIVQSIGLSDDDHLKTVYLKSKYRIFFISRIENMLCYSVNYFILIYDNR